MGETDLRISRLWSGGRGKRGGGWGLGRPKAAKPSVSTLLSGMDYILWIILATLGERLL